MKRRITKIEEQLIKDGWYLVLKRYGGNHSEKSLAYEYHKVINGHQHIITLNKKRDVILKFGIGGIKVDLLDRETLVALHNEYLDLKIYVEALKCLVDPQWKEPSLESEE